MERLHDESCHIHYYKDDQALVELVVIRHPKELMLGESHFYPEFEFAQWSGDTKCLQTTDKRGSQAYVELQDKFLELYTEEIGAVFLERKHITSKVLEKLCDNCGMRVRVCSAAFKRTHQMELELSYAALNGSVPGRKKRSDAKLPTERKLTVYDLRFLGHPTIVNLHYHYSRNKKQCERLSSLPGLDSRSKSHQIRFAARLVSAINTGLVHTLPASYISEATGIPLDHIKKWKQRELKRCKEGLERAQLRACVNAGNYNSYTQDGDIRFVTDPLEVEKTIRWHHYKFVTRTCDSLRNNPRLMGIYPSSEWDFVAKLLDGKYKVPEGKYERIPEEKLATRIPPQRLFCIAFDYMSENKCPFFDRNKYSPLLGAVIVTAFHPDSERFFEQLSTRSNEERMLSEFYRLLSEYILLSLCSPSDIPDLLDCLRPERPKNELQQWAEKCAELSCLPRYDSTKQRVGIPMFKWKFLLKTPLYTTNEQIMRLLMFNPATLSDPGWGEEPNYMLLDSPRFHIPLPPSGELDYSNVVSGISLDNLESLWRQGFLSQPQMKQFGRFS